MLSLCDSLTKPSSYCMTTYLHQCKHAYDLSNSLARSWSELTKWNILDNKLTWKEHLTSKYNKAVALFWQCKQIVGKSWGITPRIAHWVYIAVIRPMITHAVVVWWPRVELEIARVLLERLQRLACLAITGAMNTTPTAAMEILVGLVPLDIHIKQVATTTDRMISTNNWKKYGTSKSHTCIQDEIQQNIPVAGMCRDYMIPAPL